MPPAKLNLSQYSVRRFTLDIGADGNRGRGHRCMPEFTRLLRRAIGRYYPSKPNRYEKKEVAQMHNGKQHTDKIQVLLIEGDRRVRSPLKQLLIANGHHVTAFESAEQGLSAITHRHFNAVICNFQLPGISGMDFFNRSRRMLTGTTTILTAAMADNCSVNDALAAGIAVFLEMPFKIENLLACLEGRFLDICARSFGRHLYITNTGNILAISSNRRSEKPATGTIDLPPLPKAIHLPGRRWKLYLNPNPQSASHGPLSHPIQDRKKNRHETGFTLVDV